MKCVMYRRSLEVVVQNPPDESGAIRPIWLIQKDGTIECQRNVKRLVLPGVDIANDNLYTFREIVEGHLGRLKEESQADPQVIVSFFGCQLQGEFCAALNRHFTFLFVLDYQVGKENDIGEVFQLENMKFSACALATEKSSTWKVEGQFGFFAIGKERV